MYRMNNPPPIWEHPDRIGHVAVVEIEADHPKPTKARSAPPRGPIAIAGLVAFALVAGVLGYAVLGSSQGASSPTEAVQLLAEAVSSEDLLGAFNTMVPEEVAGLPELYQGALAKARELDLLSEDSSGSGKPGGIDLSINDLSTRTESLSPTISRVVIDGGTLRVHVDQEVIAGLADQALGFLGGLFGADCVASGLSDGFSYSTDDVTDTTMVSGTPGEEAASDAYVDPTADSYGGSPGDCERSEPTIEAVDETFSFAEDPIVLVTVSRDQGWFVSPMYSIAEAILNACNDCNRPAPDYLYEPVNTGFDSPEAAVDHLASAMKGLDIDAMIAASDPSELAVFRTYRALLPKEMDNDDLTIDTIEYQITDRTDTSAVVDVTKFSSTTNSGDRVTIENGCLTVNDEEGTQTSQILGAVRMFGVPTNSSSSCDKQADSQLRLVVVNNGLGWGFSAVQSIARMLRDSLDQLTPVTWARLTTSPDATKQSSEANVDGTIPVQLDQIGRSKIVVRGAQLGEVLTLPEGTISINGSRFDQMGGLITGTYLVDSNRAITMVIEGEPNSSRTVKIGRGAPKPFVLGEQITATESGYYAFTVDRPMELSLQSDDYAVSFVEEYSGRLHNSWSQFTEVEPGDVVRVFARTPTTFSVVESADSHEQSVYDTPASPINEPGFGSDDWMSENP